MILNIFVQFTFAQQHFQHFIHLRTYDGLSSNIVKDIVHDDKGYTWIITSTGLQRFDGHNYVPFLQNTDIPFQNITDIFTDDGSRLWLITSKSIWLFDPASNQVKGVSSGIDENTNQLQLFSISGRTYLITNHGIIYQYQETAHNFLKLIDLGLNNAGFAGYHVPSGSIYLYDTNRILTTDKSFKNISELEIKVKGQTGNSSIQKIKSAHLDQKEKLWISFAGGNGKSYSMLYDMKMANTSLWPSTPCKFFTSRAGTTWQFGNEIASYTNHGWEIARSFNDLPYHFSEVADTVYNISEDRDGALWIGSDNGLFVFLPQHESFNYLKEIGGFKNNISLNRNQLVHLTPLNDSVLCAALSDGRIIFLDKKFNDNKIINVRTSLKASVFATDFSGNLWIAQNNLLKVTYASTQVYSVPQEKITAIAFRNGRMLFATETGKLYSQTSSNTFDSLIFHPDSEKDFKAMPIVSIQTAGFNNSIFFCTNKQVVELADDSGIRLFKTSGDHKISSLIELETGDLLLITSKGLLSLNTDSGLLTDPLASQGLSPKNILDVVVTKSQDLWISTEGNGIFRVSSSLQEIKHYSQHEGVVYESFLPKCAAFFQNKVLFGTRQGLLSIDVEKVPAPLFNPRVRIISFRVNDREKNANGSSVLKLSWNENTVTIDYSAMTFLYRDQVRFSYMLEGYDEDWIQTTSNEKIRYVNLPSGEYNFRIRCHTLPGNEVSDETAQLFVIAVPFWKTWWFKSSVILTVLAISYLIYFEWRRRKRKIEEIRNRIALDLHDHVGSSLSSISLMLKVVESSFIRNPQLTLSVLKKISNAAHLTQENLHDVVWSMNKNKNTMPHIIGRMREFATSLFESTDAILQLRFDENLSVARLSLEKRYIFYLLFKEVVNNGAKYSSATQVAIEVKLEDNIISFSYTDNGVGFDMDQVYEGNGLKNMRTRATELEGNIEISSQPNQGTTITVTFPDR